MPDSETQALALQEPKVEPAEKPKGPKEIVVRNSDGKTFSTRLVDEKGKFVRKERPLPNAKDIVRIGRTLLNTAECGPDGKIVKGTGTRHRKIFDNLVRIATSNTDDPKALMAVIKAAELLYLRYYGKPSVSDEEIDALRVAGVKIVVVSAPNLMNPEIVQDKPKEILRPSFIDAEVVSTNER